MERSGEWHITVHKHSAIHMAITWLSHGYHYPQIDAATEYSDTTSKHNMVSKQKYRQEMQICQYFSVESMQ